MAIAGDLHSHIGGGLMVLVGVREGDTLDDVQWLAAKTVALRIFDDEQGVMNRSVIDVATSMRLGTTWPFRSTRPIAARCSS